MADIQTALKEALQEWDTGNNSTTTEEKKMDARSNMPQTFKTTNNITRMTFDYVRDNPGVTAKEAGEYIKSKGLKAHSAIAMMSASVGCGIMRREGNKYYTTVPEYMPLKKRKIVSVKPTKRPESKGIKALLAIPKPEPTPMLPKREEPFVLTAKYVIENIKIGEAKLLHKELTRIFTE
jgi:hypothetical protein